MLFFSLKSLDLMNTNYEAELSERVFTDLSEYVDQFPVYKVSLNPLYLAALSLIPFAL